MKEPSAKELQKRKKLRIRQYILEALAMALPYKMNEAQMEEAVRERFPGRELEVDDMRYQREHLINEELVIGKYNDLLEERQWTLTERGKALAEQL